MLKDYKMTIIYLSLLTILVVCSGYYYSYSREKLLQQNAALYYVNISGKQRVLAQRIVFLSQTIATNFIFKRNNHNNFMELRACINQLSSIHLVLQQFIISQVSQDSTLNDIYFGSKSLATRIDTFLDSANLVLTSQNYQELLRLNYELLKELEGEDGLLSNLELATLSQQIYAQNQIQEIEQHTYYLLCMVLLFVLVEGILIFTSSFPKTKKS